MKRSILASVATLMFAADGLAWEITQSVSPMDDSKTVHIIRDAENLYVNRYGDSGRANIQILCEENRTGLALVLPELYTSDNAGLGVVTFRVDQKPAFEVAMIAANDHGSFATISGPAIRAVKQMLGGTRLRAQFMTVNERAHLVEFDLAGIDAAVAPVRETCGW